MTHGHLAPRFTQHAEAFNWKSSVSVSLRRLRNFSTLQLSSFSNCSVHLTFPPYSATDNAGTIFGQLRYFLVSSLVNLRVAFKLRRLGGCTGWLYQAIYQYISIIDEVFCDEHLLSFTHICFNGEKPRPQDEAFCKKK